MLMPFLMIQKRTEQNEKHRLENYFYPDATGSTVKNYRKINVGISDGLL